MSVNTVQISVRMMLGLAGLILSFILWSFIFKDDSTSGILQKSSFCEKDIKKPLRFYDISTLTIKMGVVKQPERKHAISKF